MEEHMVDRLRAYAEERLVAIPDTEGDIQAALGRLDELAGLISGREEEPEHGPGVGRLATGRAREALGRISRAVREAEAQPLAQPVSPDGRYELVLVAWARMARADLVELGLAVQALGAAWGLRADELVADALREWAEVERRKPEDLVAEAARLHGLLWLPWDEAVGRLAATLPAGAGRVVLDEATHAAYQELVDRVLGVWHAGNALAPFLCRGGRADRLRCSVDGTGGCRDGNQEGEGRAGAAGDVGGDAPAGHVPLPGGATRGHRGGDEALRALQESGDRGRAPGAPGS